MLSTALQLVNLTSYRLFQLEAQYNQSLTLVATDLELHVFAVEHQQGLDVELPWGQDTAPSLFVQYSPGGGTRILKAELFVEGTPRLNQAAFGEEKLCPTNIFLQPSEVGFCVPFCVCVFAGWFCTLLDQQHRLRQ